MRVNVWGVRGTLETPHCEDDSHECLPTIFKNSCNYILQLNFIIYNWLTVYVGTAKHLLPLYVTRIIVIYFAVTVGGEEEVPIVRSNFPAISIVYVNQWVDRHASTIFDWSFSMCNHVASVCVFCISEYIWLILPYTSAYCSEHWINVGAVLQWRLFTSIKCQVNAVYY